MESLFFVAMLAFAAWKIYSWVAYSKEKEEFESQVYANQDKVRRATEAAGQSAKICVYRFRGFVSALSPVAVYCDEAPIALLSNGSYAVNEVAPGQHVVTSLVSRTPLSLSLEAGQGVLCPHRMRRLHLGL